MSFESTDTFLVREHVGLLKLKNTYDILSPDGIQIAQAKENTSTLIMMLKFVFEPRMLPFQVEILNPDNSVLLSISRGFTFLRSKVFIKDSTGKDLGYFKQRLLSIGGAFDIFDDKDQQIATLKGEWKGWNFTFTDNAGVEIGQITKKWTGLAKEFFTTADNYVVHIERTKITDVRHVQILFCAAVCIDMVLKER